LIHGESSLSTRGISIPHHGGGAYPQLFKKIFQPNSYTRVPPNKRAVRNALVVPLCETCAECNLHSLSELGIISQGIVATDLVPTRFCILHLKHSSPL